MTRDDGYTRYTVRIPTPLYERVKKAAGEASVNAEIVSVLEEKYPAPDDAFDKLMNLLEMAENMRLNAKSDHERKIARVVLNRVSEELNGLMGSSTPSPDDD